MKKILMAEYLEYNSDFKVGNHHYAEMFSESQYKVLWLSPTYNYITKMINNSIYRQRKELNQKVFPKLNKNIYGYAPHSLILYGKMPLLDTKLANKMSIKLTIPNLINTLKYNKFYEVDVLWLTNPKYYYLTEKIKYKKLIYRCADDIDGFEKVCRTMSYFEEKIIRKADVVFATAHSLIEKKEKIRQDIIYLPNGVELDNFIRSKYSMPKEFKKGINKKCIYVGAIDHWFDVDLIKYCAKKLPNIDFYLIGPIKINLNELQYFKNVYILGKKNYEDIPNYLHYSDVSIIPFKVNDLTDSITPIKLYEYMSVGLNVVSTNFKEMNYIDSPAYISKNYEEFCKYILKGIKNKEYNINVNKEFAKNNTWSKRFEDIKRVICE